MTIEIVADTLASACGLRVYGFSFASVDARHKARRVSLQIL